MRIGLVVCGALPDEYTAVAGDFADMFTALLGTCDVDLVPYDAFLGELPDDVEECDGYLISGSKSAVYDDEEWIRGLEQFVRGTVDASVPVFGVCFGLQIMAKALGGTVVKYEGGYGAGVHTMNVSDRRPWMSSGSGDHISLIMAHEDQITEVPEGATLLGSSDHCENYLVEFTPRHVGIQGHPEFPRAFAARIYEAQRSEIGGGTDDAINSLDRPVDAGTVATWMCRFFRADG